MAQLAGRQCEMREIEAFSHFCTPYALLLKNTLAYFTGRWTFIACIIVRRNGKEVGCPSLQPSHGIARRGFGNVVTGVP